LSFDFGFDVINFVDSSCWGHVEFCRYMFAMTVMKAVGGSKMWTAVHLPEDLSFEFYLRATAEAGLPLAVDSKDLDHGPCGSSSLRS
jgi:hypothetical protein